jgi:hypothetical protein
MNFHLNNRWREKAKQSGLGLFDRRKLRHTELEIQRYPTQNANYFESMERRFELNNRE